MGTIIIQCRLADESGVGKVIDIQENSTKSGAPLDAFPPKAKQSLSTPMPAFAANQTWEVLPDPAGSSHFIIRNPATGHCIEMIHRGEPLEASSANKGDNQLWDFLPDPFGSGYFFIQNPETGYVIEIENGSTKSGAALVVNRRRLFENNFQLWAGVNQDWSAATFAALSLAPAPTGFGGNNQYVLLAPDQNTNLKSITVAIDIIEDLIADHFSIQVNANAPSPADGSGARWDAQWVQFALLMQNNGLYLWNQAWHASGPDQKGDPLASYPVTSAQMLQLHENTVPAGTRIVLTLIIDHGHDDFVTGVSGQAFNDGVLAGNAISLSLKKQPTFNPGGPVKESDLAPFGALSVVVVDAPGGKRTHFTSGMGTITVTCDPAVTVSSQLNGPNPHGIQTAEDSNCYYGQVQQGSFKQIIQPFGLPRPKITGVEGNYNFAGTGLLPSSKLTATAVFYDQATVLGTSPTTVPGHVYPVDLRSQNDGSFALNIPPQIPGVLYNPGTLTMKVTDADGNWAKGVIRTDEEWPQVTSTSGLRH